MVGMSLADCFVSMAQNPLSRTLHFDLQSVFCHVSCRLQEVPYSLLLVVGTQL